jgi:hypothetical protein
LGSNCWRFIVAAELGVMICPLSRGANLHKATSCEEE